MRSSLSHQLRCLREVVGDLDPEDQADREDAERDAGVSTSCSRAQEGKASWRDCVTPSGWRWAFVPHLFVPSREKLY